MRPIITDRVAWFVSRSVCHSSESSKNGSTDQDAVWIDDSGGLKEPCIRWEVQTTAEASLSRKS